MTRLLSLLLLTLLAACDQGPLPLSTTSAGPEDPAAATANRPYRPVMAGTVDHGLGDRP